MYGIVLLYAIGSDFLIFKEKKSGDGITRCTGKDPFSRSSTENCFFSNCIVWGLYSTDGRFRELSHDHLCRATGKGLCGHFCLKHILYSKGKDWSSNNLLVSQGLTAPHWVVSCLANMCLLTQLLQKVTAFPQRCWFACNGATK